VNTGWRGYSIRELMQRAAKEIMRLSKRGPDFEKRIDLYEDMELWDAQLQRNHPVTVKIRVTVRSRILEARQTPISRP
jgi:hypothetical protein